MTVPPGYAEISVQFKHTLLSRPAFITFGVDPTSTDPTTVAQACGSAVRLAGSLGTRVDSTVTIGPTTARLGTDGSGTLVGVDTVTSNGGLSGSSAPPNVALLVHKRSGRGGRRGRGRLFIPWAVASGDPDERGTIIGTSITAWNTALQIFLVDLTTRNCPMVILHEPGRTVAPAPDIVTGLVADNLVATQRRRLGR